MLKVVIANKKIKNLKIKKRRCIFKRIKIQKKCINEAEMVLGKN